MRAVERSDGTTDLYIDGDRFHDQFCGDVTAERAARMAATQRPAAQEALTEPSGDRPLWKQVPSWFVFGELDRNIPAELEHFMAKRAHAHRTIEIPGAARAHRRPPRRDRSPHPRGRVGARHGLTSRDHANRNRHYRTPHSSGTRAYASRPIARASA